MLSRDLLKAVIQVLNPKDAHGYAWNALVDYEKSAFVVTDGHMLVQIETPEIKKSAAAAGVKGRCCISVSELKSVVKAMKARDSFDCTRAAVESFGVVDLQPCEALDLAGSYPNYTKVIPEDAKEGAPGVFGLYAAKYMKILEDIEHSASYFARTFHLPASRYGSLKVVFDCYDSMIITAVLSPVKLMSEVKNGGIHAPEHLKIYSINDLKGPALREALRTTFEKLISQEHKEAYTAVMNSLEEISPEPDAFYSHKEISELLDDGRYYRTKILKYLGSWEGFRRGSDIRHEIERFYRSPDADPDRGLITDDDAYKIKELAEERGFKFFKTGALVPLEYLE